MESADATIEVGPSAARLTRSLRDIGYDFVTALADIVDNSISANATKIDIDICFAGAESSVTVADDGDGMTGAELTEALRFGSRRKYSAGDLGKFGLGLKTASLSQCRKLTVASRKSRSYKRIEARVLDLGWIEAHDRWAIEVVPASEQGKLPKICVDALRTHSGTVVCWSGLDRVLAYDDAEGAWARRRVEQMTQEAREFLSLVFHRFLAMEVPDSRLSKISLNGEVLQPWDPFARSERETIRETGLVRSRLLSVDVGGVTGKVKFVPYVLPPRSAFSDRESFERLGGPLRWNRQQGLYIYRGSRLIQFGGWCGLRTIDEHTKLARAALDFEPALDELFQINVAKMKVSLPQLVRDFLTVPINQLCVTADHVYRDSRDDDVEEQTIHVKSRMHDGHKIGMVLDSVALQINEAEVWRKILSELSVTSPDIAETLKWRPDSEE